MIYVKTRGWVHRASAPLWRLTLWLAATLWPAMAHAQAQPQDLPRIPLTAGMHNIRAQLAITPEQHQVGLMFRKEMPANEGMLFVFDRPSPQCFWMRNTLLPLSIAFVRDDGSITNLADMKPQTDDSHCSSEPVRFVLEMNQGWFAKRGIQAGSRIGGLATAR